jgi:hypothetical protein
MLPERFVKFQQNDIKVKPDLWVRAKIGFIPGRIIMAFLPLSKIARAMPQNALFLGPLRPRSRSGGQADYFWITPDKQTASEPIQEHGGFRIVDSGITFRQPRQPQRTLVRAERIQRFVVP